MVAITKLKRKMLQNFDNGECIFGGLITTTVPITRWDCCVANQDHDYCQKPNQEQNIDNEPSEAHNKESDMNTIPNKNEPSVDQKDLQHLPYLNHGEKNFIESDEKSETASSGDFDSDCINDDNDGSDGSDGNESNMAVQENEVNSENEKIIFMAKNATPVDSCEAQENESRKTFSSKLSNPLDDIIVPHPTKFNFNISCEVWQQFYVRGHQRLHGDWTNEFNRLFEQHNIYCVLRFKTNRLKKVNSRVRKGNFFWALGVCKISTCKCIYKFIITQESVHKGGNMLQIHVDRVSEGIFYHTQVEQSRRHLSRSVREETKKECANTAPWMHQLNIIYMKQTQKNS
jgi:hypothetical protein